MSHYCDFLEHALCLRPLLNKLLDDVVDDPEAPKTSTSK